LAGSDEDRDRSRRLGVEDRGWSSTSRVVGGRTIERSGDAVSSLHHGQGDEERKFLGLTSKPWSTVSLGLVSHWYKLHVSNCHGSWVILKDQLCFTFFLLSKIIDLRNEVLNFTQKEEESLGAAWSKYNQLALSGLELSIPDALFMQHFVHRLGTKFTEMLDMTYGGVFFSLHG
jgi:hypothetical protein